MGQPVLYPNPNAAAVPNATLSPNPNQLPPLSLGQPSSSRGVKRPSSSQPLLTENNEEGWTKDEGTGNVYTASKVGINTTNPQEALSVVGNVSYLNFFYQLNTL